MSFSDIDAENVRRFLDGEIIGEPSKDTLAHRVWAALEERERKTKEDWIEWL